MIDILRKKNHTGGIAPGVHLPGQLQPGDCINELTRLLPG